MMKDASTSQVSRRCLAKLSCNQASRISKHSLLYSPENHLSHPTASINRSHVDTYISVSSDLLSQATGKTVSRKGKQVAASRRTSTELLEV